MTPEQAKEEAREAKLKEHGERFDRLRAEAQVRGVRSKIDGLTLRAKREKLAVLYEPPKEGETGPGVWKFMKGYKPAKDATS